MPNIHEIDFEALTREWESEGHKLGTLKGIDGDSAESSSKVIKRMLKEKSPTFFIQRAPRKLRGKENEKREGKEKERKRGDARLLEAIWHSEKESRSYFLVHFALALPISKFPPASRQRGASRSSRVSSRS